MLRNLSAVSCAAALFLLAARAEGEPAIERAMAITAFNEGMALSKAGLYPAACAKLEESLRLEAQAGTRFWLADCYEHLGRTASAWGLFLKVATEAEGIGNKTREDTARARARVLEPGLARLTVVVPDAVAKTPGLTVLRDEAPLGAALWGTALPVDPGKHTLRATAPGKQAWEATITVDARSGKIEIPALRDAGPAPAGPAPALEPVFLPEAHTDFVLSGDVQPPLAPTQMHDGDGGWHRPAAIGAAAVGAAGVVVGSVTGVLAITTWHQATALCTPRCAADAPGKASTASAFATVSTVGFVVGGTALGGSLALWLTRPRARNGAGTAQGASGSTPVLPSLVVTPALGGLAAGGYF